MSQEWSLKYNLLNGILPKREGRAYLCLLLAVLHATLSMAVYNSVHTLIELIPLSQRFSNLRICAKDHMETYTTAESDPCTLHSLSPPET